MVGPVAPLAGGGGAAAACGSARTGAATLGGRRQAMESKLLQAAQVALHSGEVVPQVPQTQAGSAGARVALSSQLRAAETSPCSES